MKFPYRNENISIQDFRKNFSKNDKVIGITKINRNTFSYFINGEKRIRLYETDIILFKKNHIIINTSGFDSKLTMNRINDSLSDIFRLYYLEPDCYIHPNIYIKKGIWYYQDKFKNSYRFFDGIKINKKTSKVINQKAKKFKKIDNHNKMILKLINAYCDKIKKMKELPKNTAGDCMFCNTNLFNKNDTEHLFLHLKEKYIMKSLIYRALKEKGFNPYFNYEVLPNRKSIIISIRSFLKNHLIKYNG